MDEIDNAPGKKKSYSLESPILMQVVSLLELSITQIARSQCSLEFNIRTSRLVMRNMTEYLTTATLENRRTGGAYTASL